MKTYHTRKRAMSIPIRMLSIVSLIAFAGAVSADTIVYSHDFNGTGALNGKAVDTGAGTWSANTLFQSDGTFADAGAQGSAILLFTPTVNQQYRLEVSFRNMSGSDWDYLAAGFVCDDAIAADGTIPFGGSPRGQNWMKVNRPNGRVDAHGSKTHTTGGNAHGQVVFGKAPHVRNMDLRIDMTLTHSDGDIFDVAYYAKDKDATDWTLIGAVTGYHSASKTIKAVGFGIDDASVSTAGYIESFKLTAISKPSTVVANSTPSTVADNSESSTVADNSESSTVVDIPEPSMLGLVVITGMVALFRRPRVSVD